jgi:hypothetical protein
MPTIEEIIAEKQRATIPSRLLNGARILGSLWQAGVRCRSEWSGVCPCEKPVEFCVAKKKWLGLVLELYEGKYPYELTGMEGLLVLECMDSKMFEATGLTILLAPPGVRAPLRVGRRGTCGQTILDLVAIPEGKDRDDAIEAVILIQEVQGAGQK